MRRFKVFRLGALSGEEASQLLPLKALVFVRTEAGGEPIMMQPSATETTQLTSDGRYSYHTDTGFN